MKAPTPARDMAQEMAAAAALKEQLKAILGEAETDAAILKDMVEGETDLYGAIDAVVQQIGEDTARVEGIGKFQKALDAREHRLNNRIETLRAMLTNALDMLGTKRMERPIATITLKPVPPKLNVVDESQVPSTFYVRPEPALSRKQLGDALKARAEALDALAKEFADAPPDDPAYRQRFDEVIAAHPPIPGAELDNGSVTVQIRFS
jgi:hypothetical protein